MLSPRSALILKSIVERYVDNAVPVPSQSIIHAYGLEVSSATIRNEMMRLEQEGYIIRPHTSAGSVPSDKGYRFYVETLRGIRLPANQQRMVSHLFHQVETRIDEWVRLTASILSHLGQNMALVATARANRAVFKHLELVSIQERTALLVLVLQGARVRQQLIALAQPANQADLALISSKLNAACVGTTSDTIGSRTANLNLSETESTVAGTILDIMRNEDTVTFEEPYLEGLQFIFSQPEFAAPRRAQTLADLLEQKNLVRIMLPRGVGESGVRAYIGSENESESVQDLSIIVSRYGLPGEAVGYVALVGPTRMPYPTSIASVDYLAEVLTRLMARLYGREIQAENISN